MFWQLVNSDPYRALSFDRLHGFHLGLWKDHLWVALKHKIEALGRWAIKKVDDQWVETTLMMLNLTIPRAAGFPQWRGLVHFSSVMSVGFSDGSKYEDFSKVFLLSIPLSSLADQLNILTDFSLSHAQSVSREQARILSFEGSPVSCWGWSLCQPWSAYWSNNHGREGEGCSILWIDKSRFGIFPTINPWLMFAGIYKARRIWSQYWGSEELGLS